MTDRQREKMFRFGERYSSPASVIQRQPEVTATVEGIGVEVTEYGHLLFGPRTEMIGALTPEDAVLALERGFPVALQRSGTNMRVLVELWAVRPRR